jgi:hypothetical protein
MEKSSGKSVDLFSYHRETASGRKRMERTRNDGLPRRKADVDSLKKELEQVYQTVKATCGERREQTPALSVEMVIKGK